MKHLTRSTTSKRIPKFSVMTCSDTTNSGENVDYEKTSAVNSLQLIHEVKKYELLYNPQAEGYNDFAKKELVWEKIHEAMYKNYRSLPDSTQNIIKQTIRRRWKSLRNSMAKDVRVKITNKNYQRKTDNPLLAEMQFLLPFIRSIYAKVAQRQNNQTARHNFAEENTMFNDIANVAFEEDNDLIDLTETDAKPFSNLKTDRSICVQNCVEPDSTPNNNREEPVSTSNNDQREPFHNGYCVTECNAGEFATTLAYTGQEVDDANETIHVQQHPPAMSATTPENRRKRPATGETEFQEKLFELLSNSVNNRRDHPPEREPENEDRMFLLSLVSDLKSIPTAKKMLIKAEIVTAIARGQQ